MVSQRWTHSNKSIFNIGYHLIWCPKYRRKVFIGKVEERLKELLLIKARELQINIDTMEVMPDHLHLFVKANPTLPPHYIVQQFKGVTSNKLRKEFPELMKMPTLWTRSYYCESVGHISEKTIKKYIEDQKNK